MYADGVTSATLTLLATSALLAAALTWIARALGRRLTWHDTPGSRGHAKHEIRPVPNVGGTAIFWTITALVGAGFAAAEWFPGLIGSQFPAFEAHIPGVRSQAPMGLGVLAAALALHITGLIDDRRALPAIPKLLVIAAASAAVVILFDVRLLTMLDAHAGGPWLSIALTVVWFVTVTNAMNFMDNMDGLSAGVGAVAGGLFLTAALIHGQWFVAMALAAVVGSLIGFLVFNFPWPGRRASIFMGDGGSLVVGFLLAFLTVRTTYAGATVSAEPSGVGWYAVFMPLCVLAVPLYDLISVCIIRIAQGKSPLVGDQQHFSHRLRARGLTVRQTLAVIYGCTAVTGIGGLVLGSLSGWAAALIGVQTVLVLVLLGIYEHASGTKAQRP